jgi:hypothetical protein
MMTAHYLELVPMMRVNYLKKGPLIFVGYNESVNEI